MKKVVDKENLLYVIKSEFGKVFGGFMSIKRISQGRGFHTDKEAFIFSLTNKTKHA